MRLNEDSAKRSVRALKALRAVAAKVDILLSVFAPLFLIASALSTNGHPWRRVKVFFILLVFLAFTALMTWVVLMVKRRDPKADSLKATLIGAFSQALDSSPFNPKRAKQDSHG